MHPSQWRPATWVLLGANLALLLSIIGVMGSMEGLSSSCRGSEDPEGCDAERDFGLSWVLMFLMFIVAPIVDLALGLYWLLSRSRADREQ